MSDKLESTVENTQLVSDVRHLIDAAKERAAVAVNAEISILYWQAGYQIGGR